eukprot:CAMPEP_0196999938 /NCGR_PEP_ID=MMETSP1380-20130617/5017_1 /TAXON_ID=5936 /ORGANISM="Euplotes crassus, Strain CT5" /LENGTH=196 /DNA_ID=CAMNT_0042417063 /DNA_START=1 /DNA_END=588 /DNA_ORIENTATION=-
MKVGYLLNILLCLLVATSLAEDDLSFEDGDGAQILPIELTDETFEHLTQAATGATTGDWFVKFYAPWCGHCQKLAPTWDELAVRLDKKINIAKINVDDSPNTAERFNIRGFPTLLFFKRGKVYKYTDHDRSVEALAAFTEGGYTSSEEQGEVPKELTTLGYANKVFWKFYNEVIFGFDTVFHMFEMGHLPWYVKFW